MSNCLSLIVSLSKLCMKFTIGFLFGAICWKIIIEPYTKYFSFGLTCPAILLSLSLLTGVLFAISKWSRSIMVLFLPSMLSSASQNYIIMLLFINLFSGPVTSVALNAVESIRVIGCSLTLSFDHLKDRAKLIMAPVIEVLTGSIKSDINSMGADLMEIQNMVSAIKNEAELSRNNTDLLKVPLAAPAAEKPDESQILNDIRQRLKLDEDIVNKTRDLIRSSKLDLDSENFTLKATVDAQRLEQLMKANMSYMIEDFNVTRILYESCLSVFRGAKAQCDEAVEDMRVSCRDSVGYLLSSLVCSPVLFTIDSICPWLMDQVIDERSICNTMQASMANKSVDPFNLTGGADINMVYRNLTEKLSSLRKELISDEVGFEGAPKRLELNISINDKTLRLLLKTRDLWKFITDKYRLRRAFYNLLLLLYEIYTSITFLLILGQAVNYQRNYRKRVKFDNTYVTGMFRLLDQRRRSAKKETALPLTKEEAKRYISTFTCRRRTKEEKRNQRASCTVILLFLAFALSLMYIDDIFYSILSSIHEHALIKFRELGHHDLQVRVMGEGPLARVARQLAVHFNTTYNLDKFSTTSPCLPRPESTSAKLNVEFLYLVLVYVFIDQASIYAMRFRRVIMAFFYTEKEELRIAYLYNRILMNRRRLKRDRLLTLNDDAYGDDDDDDDDDNRGAGADKDIFTLRDAMVYIKNCVRDSVCCRYSRCCGQDNSSDNYYDDRWSHMTKMAPRAYKLLSGNKR